MRYRILIQNRDELDKHIAHITFETNAITAVIHRIKVTIAEEISAREKLLARFLAQKRKDFVQQLMDEVPDDLIDWGSKGNDISKKEFMENELYFALRE